MKKRILYGLILILCLTLKGLGQPSKATISSSYPIIFIHGITGGFKDWQPTIDRLSNTSFKMGPLYKDNLFHKYMNNPPPGHLWLWNITYYSPNPIVESLLGNLDIYTQRLDKIITSIQSLTNSKKVILIAHSMGGLIARNVMVQSQSHWDRVHKILTIATPHNGVITSIGVVGQLEDLGRNSLFIQTLKKKWATFITPTTKKWGVVGAIDSRLHTLKPPFLKHYTDGGGPGFVELHSSIPYGEWEPAFNTYFLKARYNTPHFGYRKTLIGQHKKLVNHNDMIEALQWAISPLAQP